MHGKPDKLLRSFSARYPPQDAVLPPYNLFSRNDAPDLYCAIPQDRPVPSFIDCNWQFKGSFDRSQRAPHGFIPTVASASVRMNGYYVFMRYDSAPSSEGNREVCLIFDMLAKERKGFRHEEPKELT